MNNRIIRILFLISYFLFLISYFLFIIFIMNTSTEVSEVVSLSVALIQREN